MNDREFLEIQKNCETLMNSIPEVDDYDDDVTYHKDVITDLIKEHHLANKLFYADIDHHTKCLKKAYEERKEKENDRKYKNRNPYHQSEFI